MLVRRYLAVPSERVAIIERVHNSGRMAAIRLFSKKIGVAFEELWTWIKKHYRAKKLKKHRKQVRLQPGDPPAHDLEAEAAELAEELVGAGGGEWREGRRNTFAKTLNNRARRQAHRSPWLAAAHELLEGLQKLPAFFAPFRAEFSS